METHPAVQNAVAAIRRDPAAFSEILPTIIRLAQVHLGDGDILGQYARSVLAFLDPHRDLEQAVAEMDRLEDPSG
jgi:hypothetical protein